MQTSHYIMLIIMCKSRKYSYISYILWPLLWYARARHPENNVCFDFDLTLAPLGLTDLSWILTAVSLHPAYQCCSYHIIHILPTLANFFSHFQNTLYSALSSYLSTLARTEVNRHGIRRIVWQQTQSVEHC